MTKLDKEIITCLKEDVKEALNCNRDGEKVLACVMALKTYVDAVRLEDMIKGENDAN